MLSLSEITKCTLPAKFIHQRADAPYFKREINQLSQPWSDGKERRLVNFFIRYRVSPRDSTLYRWSQIERVVDLKDIPPKSTSTSSTNPGSSFPSASTSPVGSGTPLPAPGTATSNTAPPQLSSSAAKDSLMWGNKRFFVAFQVVGESRPILLTRLSNSPPTMEEVLAFCAREATERPQIVGSDPESMVSSHSNSSAAAILPPEAYLPTSAEVAQLYRHRVQVLEPPRTWSREEVEEHRLRQAPYAAAAAAAAPVQRTSLDNANRQFLAHVQEAQLQEQQRQWSMRTGAVVPPSSPLPIVSSTPLSSTAMMHTDVDGLGRGGTGPIDAVAGTAVLKTSRDDEIGGAVNRQGTPLELFPSPSAVSSTIPFHDPNEGHFSSSSSLLTSASPYFPPTNMKEPMKGFSSSFTGDGGGTPQPLPPRSPFLPKNRKRSRPSLESVLTGVPAVCSSPSSSQEWWSGRSFSLPDGSEGGGGGGGSLSLAGRLTSSQVDSGRTVSSRTTRTMNDNKRDAMHILSSLSQSGSPTANPLAVGGGRGDATAFLDPSPSSSQEWQGGLLATAGADRRFPPMAPLSGAPPSSPSSPFIPSGPPRRTTTILENSGMAMAEAAAARAMLFLSPPEILPMGSTTAFATAMGSGGIPAEGGGTPWMASERSATPGGVRGPPLPSPSALPSMHTSVRDVVGESPLESLLTPKRIEMWGTAAVNETHFHSYVSNPEREGYQLKVSALTKRNQKENKKRLLLGLEKQQRFKRTGNLQESSGLWVTDDAERAQKASSYTSRTAGDTALPGAGNTPASAATGASTAAKTTTTPTTHSNEKGNAAGEDLSNGEGGQPHAGKSVKKGVEFEDPKVRKFKEDRAAASRSLGSVPNALFEQLLASTENSPLLPPFTSTPIVASPTVGSFSVERGGVREQPFRLLTSPSLSNRSFRGTAQGTFASSEVGKPPHCRTERAEVETDGGTSTEKRIPVPAEPSTPFSPLHIRSQLIHRSAVVSVMGGLEKSRADNKEGTWPSSPSNTAAREGSPSPRPAPTAST